MPPLIYLQEIPEPQIKTPTNGHMLNWAIELRAALRLANSDKAALRAWSSKGAELSPPP
ncbi:MAG: Rz1-like lysis system protein LysC [Candidatus Adiutrix sp.]